MDTNTCIHLIKYHPSSLQEKLSSIPVGEVGISSIVSAELWYGVAFSLKKKENEEALKDFLRYIVVLDWPQGAAPLYGEVRAELRRRGTPIGAMDLLIGVHALFLKQVLVTNNQKEFKRIRGLELENWETGKPDDR
jgi:tRNA(fMet)-specific endonuclease VapC